MKQPYIIVSASLGYQALEVKVNVAIEKGYIPQGGLIISDGKYYQSMFNPFLTLRPLQNTTIEDLHKRREIGLGVFCVLRHNDVLDTKTLLKTKPEVIKSWNNVGPRTWKEISGIIEKYRGL